MTSQLIVDRNANYGQSLDSWYRNYTKEVDGAQNVVKFTEKTVKLANEYFPFEKLRTVASSTSLVQDVLEVISLPKAMHSAYSAVSALDIKDGVAKERKMFSAVNKILGVVASWISFLTLAIASASLRLIASAVSLGSELFSIPFSVKDYFQSAQIVKEGGNEEKRMYRSSENFYFYKTLKSTLSIASKVFLLCSTIFGCPLLPKVGSLALSWVISASALRRDYLQDSSEFRIAKFK